MSTSGRTTSCSRSTRSSSPATKSSRTSTRSSTPRRKRFSPRTRSSPRSTRWRKRRRRAPRRRTARRTSSSPPCRMSSARRSRPCSCRRSCCARGQLSEDKTPADDRQHHASDQGAGAAHRRSSGYLPHRHWPVEDGAAHRRPGDLCSVRGGCRDARRRDEATRDGSGPGPVAARPCRETRLACNRWSGTSWPTL